MIEIDQDHDILGIVDVQPTFMPGGELPVEDGHAVVPAINRLLASHFRHAFATQDWHPAGHSSFASAHQGREPFGTIAMPYGPQTLWPDHAVIGSSGAQIHADLDQRRIEMVLRKGFRPEIDSYSAFRENDRQTVTGLEGWLRARNFRRLFLVGLATDFCVAWSAEDAADLGYDVFVIQDCCRGIGLPLPGGRTTMDAAHSRFAERGIHLIASTDLG